VHRLSCHLLVLLFLVACNTSSVAQNTPSPSSASPTPSSSPALTLDEEIGAVMMVGFRGPLSSTVVADWTQHQYGGLLIVNLNHNAQTASDASALITQLRAVTRHRMIAATDQEGGDVCIALSSVPCRPMPVGQSGTTLMANALKSAGFDLDLGPVSDVCSGPTSIMWGRCYGTSPGPVATDVGAVVDGIHAAHMLSAAKHFPGHGDTTVSS
jgi:beta-N-acetylhexosaminidase